MKEYRVMMTIDDKIIDGAICSGSLEKCQTALNHLYGLVSRAKNVGWVILPCID